MKKKLVFVSVIAILFAFGCRKGVEISNDKKMKSIDMELSLLREKVSKNKATRKAWLKYGRSDVGGAVSTYQLTAGIVGPGYGAAFGLLGGLLSSTLTYIEDHRVIGDLENPDPLHNTNGYTNSEEEAGFVHNTEILNALRKDFYYPNSTHDFVEHYYDKFAQIASSRFAIPLNVIHVNFTKALAVTMLDKIRNIQSSEDFIRQGILDNNSNTTAAFIIFVNDVNNERCTFYDLSRFVNLHTRKVNLSTTLNISEKEKLKVCFQIFKYSASLWMSQNE